MSITFGSPEAQEILTKDKTKLATNEKTLEALTSWRETLEVKLENVLSEVHSIQDEIRSIEREIKKLS